jgi:hypothetical protein
MIFQPNCNEAQDPGVDVACEVHFAGALDFRGLDHVMVGMDLLGITGSI